MKFETCTQERETDATIKKKLVLVYAWLPQIFGNFKVLITKENHEVSNE
jgi:hypothetical protein